MKDGYPNAHAMVLGTLMGCGDSSLSSLMKNKEFRADEILYVGLQELHDYQENFLRNIKVSYSVQAEQFLRFAFASTMRAKTLKNTGMETYLYREHIALTI